jgi:hypothetical protein
MVEAEVFAPCVVQVRTYGLAKLRVLRDYPEFWDTLSGISSDPYSASRSNDNRERRGACAFPKTHGPVTWDERNTLKCLSTGTPDHSLDGGTNIGHSQSSCWQTTKFCSTPYKTHRAYRPRWKLANGRERERERERDVQSLASPVPRDLGSSVILLP